MCRHKSTATTRGYELGFDCTFVTFETENVDPLAYWSQSTLPWQGSEFDWVVLYYAHAHLPANGSRPTIQYHQVYVRYWAVLLSAAILPSLWLRHYRRRQRDIKQGHCLKCGYDLRASKERCPECGTPIPAGALPVGEDKPVSRPS